METPEMIEEKKEDTNNTEEMDINEDGEITIDDVKEFLTELASGGKFSAKDFDDLRDFISTLESKDVEDLEDPEAEAYKEETLPGVENSTGDTLPNLF